jgi:short-subunit dehydrogenase
MSIFQDKVIIVTGASEGIGRALSLALAPQKPKLVLAARNENRLEKLKEEVESEGVLIWGFRQNNDRFDQLISL